MDNISLSKLFLLGRGRKKATIVCLAQHDPNATPLKTNAVTVFRESPAGTAGAERELLAEAGIGRNRGGGGSKGGDCLRGSRGRRRKGGRKSKPSGGLADAREVCGHHFTYTRPRKHCAMFCFVARRSQHSPRSPTRIKSCACLNMSWTNGTLCGIYAIYMFDGAPSPRESL